MTKLLLFATGLVLFHACIGIEIVLSPPELTRVVGAQAQFQAIVSNLTIDESITLTWTVNGEFAASVTYFNSSIPVTDTSSVGYEIQSSVELENRSITTQFSIISVVLLQNPANITFSGKDANKSATLNTQEECENLPSGFQPSACANFSCNASTTTFPGAPASNPNSALLYTCFNQSTCRKEGQWSSPVKLCDNVPVGCSESGKWGTNCTVDCGEGCDGGCDFSNGTCSCKVGYIGPLCVEVSCSESGKWGTNCSVDCGEGCDGGCDFSNGTCSCNVGYIGPLCVERGCSEVAKWGENCTNYCGEGCSENECHFGNGSCACVMGYIGSLCDKKNSTPCDNNAFGLSCNLACSDGCRSKTCDRISGACSVDSEYSTACKPGLIGDYCNKTGCPTGLWGNNCTKVCGDGCRGENGSVALPGNCSFATGDCDNPECAPGYQGADCKEAMCSNDCSPGVCLTPNSCQLCGIHFASGNTCRNIRLDGFLKGSLPTFAVLSGVVIFLTVSSKWYIRRKVKAKNN